MLNASKINRFGIANGNWIFFVAPKTPTRQDKEYCLFGSTMPGRSYQSSTPYKFGFNGKENDDEIKGTGNSINYDARLLDTRLGLWLSTDPERMKYPNLSPYTAFANNPVYYIDNGGRTLGVGGSGKENKMQAKSDIYDLLPADGAGFDYRSQLTINDNGKVSFNINKAQAEASGDAGVMLVYNLVNAKEHYQYNIQNTAEVVEVRNKKPNSSGKVMNGEISKNAKIAEASKRKLDLQSGKTYDNSGKEIGGNLNISSTSKSQFGDNIKGVVPSSFSMPADPTNDAELVMTPNNKVLQPYGNGMPKPRIPLLFHEMQELYNRTTLKQPYSKAHPNSAKTEESLPSNDCRRDECNEGKGWPAPR